MYLPKKSDPGFLYRGKKPSALSITFKKPMLHRELCDLTRCGGVPNGHAHYPIMEPAFDRCLNMVTLSLSLKHFLWKIYSQMVYE